MQPDITVKDAFAGLKNPKGFLDGVLVHMRSCNLAHGNAFLRLGASSQSTGRYPCYRVVFQKAGAEKIFGSFIDSHKAFSEPYDKVSPGAWSTSATELNEVIALALSDR